jgi:hypothetical protein
MTTSPLSRLGTWWMRRKLVGIFPPTAAQRNATHHPFGQRSQQLQSDQTQHALATWERCISTMAQHKQEVSL